jgi:hypothetical protein
MKQQHRMLSRYYPTAELIIRSMNTMEDSLTALQRTNRAF